MGAANLVRGAHFALVLGSVVGVKQIPSLRYGMTTIWEFSELANTGVPSTSLRTGFSTWQRTMELSAAAVEMTFS
jgi:hypothetical protein